MNELSVSDQCTFSADAYDQNALCGRRRSVTSQPDELCQKISDFEDR